MVQRIGARKSKKRQIKSILLSCVLFLGRIYIIYLSDIVNLAVQSMVDEICVEYVSNGGGVDGIELLELSRANGQNVMQEMPPAWVSASACAPTLYNSAEKAAILEDLLADMHVRQFFCLER